MGRSPHRTKHLPHVGKLAVKVAADIDGRVDFEEHGLLDDDIFGLVAQAHDLLLGEDKLAGRGNFGFQKARDDWVDFEGSAIPEFLGAGFLIHSRWNSRWNNKEVKRRGGIIWGVNKNDAGMGSGAGVWEGVRGRSNDFNLSQSELNISKEG